MSENNVKHVKQGIIIEIITFSFIHYKGKRKLFKKEKLKKKKKKQEKVWQLKIKILGTSLVVQG